MPSKKRAHIDERKNITFDSDLEDFAVGEDHEEHGATSALGAGPSSSKAPKTALDSAKPEPRRPTAQQVGQLTKMAAGKLKGDQGTKIALHGDNAALSAQNMLDKHLSKMLRLFDKVESSGIGLRAFCESPLFREIMGFKSTCFTVDNRSMQPLLAACEAPHKKVIALFLALCGIREHRISRKALEGPPGRQSNDSLAGASAAVEALKLALFECMPGLEQRLADRGLVFEDTIEYFNLFDQLDCCCRVGMKKGEPFGTNCSSFISKMQELGLQLLVKLLANDGVQVASFLPFAASPCLVAARIADAEQSCFAWEPEDEDDHNPYHIKHWRGALEDTVKYMLCGANAMAPAALHLLSTMGIENLPEVEALQSTTYRHFCVLKLRDNPSLAPLPAYADARAFVPTKEQRVQSALDSINRRWESRDAEKKHLATLQRLLAEGERHFHTLKAELDRQLVIDDSLDLLSLRTELEGLQHVTLPEIRAEAEQLDAKIRGRKQQIRDAKGVIVVQRIYPVADDDDDPAAAPPAAAPTAAAADDDDDDDAAAADDDDDTSAACGGDGIFAVVVRSSTGNGGKTLKGYIPARHANFDGRQLAVQFNDDRTPPVGKVIAAGKLKVLKAFKPI